MYTSKDLIKLLKEKENLPSDYAVSKFLGVTSQSIYKIQNKNTCFSEETCVLIAEHLHLDPLQVIACIQVEAGIRDKNQKKVDAWTKYAIHGKKAVDKSGILTV